MMEPLISVGGRKRRSSSCPGRATDFTKCIICQKTAPELGELSKLTDRGLPRLKEAVLTRQDDFYTRIWADMEEEELFLAKNPVVHITCRSNYTHKKHLEPLQSKRKRTEECESSTGEPSAPSSLRTRSAAGSGTDAGRSIDYNKSVCFICEKERDNRGKWNLIAIATPDGRQKAIHQKAKELNDEAMLLKIMGHGETCIDMVANNFHYHKRCIDRYLARRKPKDKSSSQLSEHDEAFSALVAEISDGLLNEKHVYSINQLSKRYNALLPQRGKREYRTDRLMKRIIKHFTGDKVQVVNLKNTDLLCSSSLTVKELCDQVLDLNSDLEECQLLFDSEDECVHDDSLHANVSLSSYHLAKHLRTEVKVLAKGVNMSEIEISYGAALCQVPVNLYNHLAWLLFDIPDTPGEDGRVGLPNDRMESVLNLAQDIISLLSKQPTPKQVGLGLHVFKETRTLKVNQSKYQPVSYIKTKIMRGHK